MKYKLTILLVLLVGAFMCIKEKKVDITNYEAVKECSLKFTGLNVFDQDNSLIFKTIYGEYDFNDSTRLTINPNGEYFYMKYLYAGKWEIVKNGVMSAIIMDNKLYLTSDQPTQVTGEVLYCTDVLWDVKTNKAGYLICKCTL